MAHPWSGEISLISRFLRRVHECIRVYYIFWSMIIWLLWLYSIWFKLQNHVLIISVSLLRECLRCADLHADGRAASDRVRPFARRSRDARMGLAGPLAFVGRLLSRVALRLLRRGRKAGRLVRPAGPDARLDIRICIQTVWGNQTAVSGCVHQYIQHTLLQIAASRSHNRISFIRSEQIIHLGGDEVSFDCWKSNPNVSAFMSKRGFGQDYAKLQAYYMDRVLQYVLETLELRPMVWQEVFQNDPNVDRRAVVDVWTGSWQQLMAQVTQAGNPAILSACW